MQFACPINYAKGKLSKNKHVMFSFIFYMVDTTV